MNIRLICLVAFISLAKGSRNSTVDYYVNLIQAEIARANVYPLPEDSSAYKPTSNDTFEYGTFDYIVVGAGSAGAVISTRLSELQSNKILLLEAGSEETHFSEIPKMLAYLRGLEFNWNYNTTSQNNSCLGMLKRKCPYPRGKSLGGSSAINALMYVRGNQKDYDNWHRQGNPGWSYNDVLRFFKKSENSQVDGDPGFHGRGGYLNVEYHQPYSPQFDTFIEANLELGRKIVDYNGVEQLGVARTQLNTINGRRDSTARAFLRNAANRTNLEILPHSLATKILIDSSTKKAHGVVFSHRGKLYTANARQEVIISAGSFGSPQLLMLSGIGPKPHLESLGIPVIQDLAVGENLQDHPTYPQFNVETNYTEPLQALEKDVQEYLANYGDFTIAGNSQGLGFYETKLNQEPGLPDIEIIMNPSTSPSNLTVRGTHYNDETAEALYSGLDSSRTFTMFVILLHPKSRGCVRLQSNNPYDYPLIDANYHSDVEGDDIETLYEGIQLAMEIINTNAFKKLNATLRYDPLPACQQYDYLSKEFWYCQIKHLTSNIHHPVGTCRMGPDPSKGAVVDHLLKVHGIKNLRVADASIIPDVVSGHTNAPAIMIGEKLADLIKNGK